MNEPKHTPGNPTKLPWTIIEGRTLLHIETANQGDGSPCGMPVCSLPKSRRKDAEYIVRACNALPVLVEALEKAKTELICHQRNGVRSSVDDTLELVRAALAKAQPEEETAEEIERELKQQRADDIADHDGQRMADLRKPEGKQ